MRTRNVKKLISSALGLIVLGSLWFYFAPVPLGGSATYVVTHGISMEPRFHTGDLAIVRSQSSYHVGEIVAYQNKMLHTIVLHRIIGRSGNRYIFKGDNNNFIDFEHPQANQLMGALWLHIPGAGATLKSIRSPALVGILVAVGMLLFTGAAFGRRRRRRRRQRRGDASTERGFAHASSRATEPVVTILTIGLLALLPFVMLALLAFTRPPTKLHSAPVPYAQSGTFSYSASAAPGPTYPGGQAVTGDPLFTRVLNDVNVQFDYKFASAAKHSVAGKAALSATLSSTSGWSTTFPLGAATYFHGNHATVAATLDLQSLLALTHNVESTTRVSGSYTLTLTPHVSTTGNLDHLPLSATFAPQLQFSLNELEAQPILGNSSAATNTGATPTSGVLAPSTTGSLPAKSYAPLFVSIKIARMPVATARTVALVGIAIVISALLTILLLVLPRLRPRDATSTIQARYGHLLIPVAQISQTAGVSVIDVADMQALVRIAEHYDRSILHEAYGGGEAFWVTDESGQFRYAVGGPAPVASPASVPGPAPVAAPAPVPVADVVAPAPLGGLTSDVYADELELGGVIAAFETQPAPEPAPVSPVLQDSWAAYDLADAMTQESRPGWDAAPAWPQPADQTAEHRPTRAGDFARVAGFDLSS